MIPAGRLLRASLMPCADCSEPASGYDHRDYNQPLRVDPVCRRCNYRRGSATPRAWTFKQFMTMAAEVIPSRIGRTSAEVLHAMERNHFRGPGGIASTRQRPDRRKSQGALTAAAALAAEMPEARDA